MELKKRCDCKKSLCCLVLLKSTSISSKTCNKGMVTSTKDCQKSHTTIIESKYQQNDSVRYVLKRNLKFIRELYALTALTKEIINYPILPPSPCNYTLREILVDSDKSKIGYEESKSSNKSLI